jgi:hypothetical protein
MLRDEEHAFDVDLHNATPGLGWFIDHTSAAADAYVVIQQVQPTEGCNGAFDELPAGVLVGHIGGMGRSTAALSLNHVGGALSQLQLSINDEDASAGAGEQNGRGTSVTYAISGGASASHDCHFALEPELFPQVRSRH